MPSPEAPTRDPVSPPIHFAEFVALIAALMAVGALGIDTMLPALPDIGRDLGLQHENLRQLVISIYLASFGLGQLVHGPLCDRYGRRPVLVAGLALYAVANAAAALATSFEVLIVTRIVAGLAIASTRVVTVALVRDCFSGRPMARVMSLIFIVFLIVPVIAPTVGQAILLFGSWRTIFWIITGASFALIAWFMLRMPETLRPEHQVEISLARLRAGYAATLTDRWSLGYALASGVLQAALIGYLTSIQQIMAETFSAAILLNIVFAVTAGTMGLANFVNSRLVLRLGSRRISHSALVMLIVLAGIGLVVGERGYETLVTFTIFQALAMGCFGLANANFQAMAMENMGEIAGTASSVQGLIVMTIGTVGGSLIGLSFAGTTTPYHLGLLIAGVVAFGIVFVAERGRMFRPV